MAVFTPIRSPFMSTSGPPELPGLIAASVWMNEETLLAPMSERASAETMPLVTVWPTPNGSPIASTRSPTCTSVAVVDGERPAAARPPASIFSTARSARGSSSSTLAGHSRRSEVTTVISCAPSMTWWLVRITPSGRTIEPEPSDWATRSCGMPPPMNMPQNGSTWVRTTRLREDVDHRRRGLAHHRREREPHRGRVGRNLAMVGRRQVGGLGLGAGGLGERQAEQGEEDRSVHGPLDRERWGRKDGFNRRATPGGCPAAGRRVVRPQASPGRA